ncbi:MAG: hypothetical protein RLZZ28_2595 [Bacteroidota bacterium]
MKIALVKFLNNYWAALIASGIGCSFLYFFTKHSGIGVSPDSVSYLTAANNILEQFSFTDFNGKPLVDFPLGYPSLLALLSRLTGVSIQALVPFLNYFFFTGLVFFSSRLMQAFNPANRLVEIGLLTVLACSPCLLEVYSMLWSETFFLFLSLYFLVALKKYFSHPGFGNLLLISLITALAFDTRYAGICFVATGGYLILFYGALPASKKIFHLIFFGTVGSSLVGINLLRNHFVAGHLTGVREKAIRTLGDSLNQLGLVLSEWLPFLKGQEKITAFIFVFVLLVAVFVLINRTLQQQFFPSVETIVVCFLVLYTFFILLVSSISRFEDLSSRLLSPIYIPLLLLAASQYIILWENGIIRNKRLLFFFGWLVFLGFHINHFRQNSANWEGIRDAGIPGYTEDSWTKSPTVEYIKKLKKDLRDPVFANAPDAVYFLTGIRGQGLPHKEIEKEKALFMQNSAFYLVWFTDGENPDLVNLEFIKQHKKMASVQSFEDGTVYYFKSE